MRSLEEIRALCDAATPGPWLRSRFVDSSHYRKMSKEWKQEADKEERTHVIRGAGQLGTTAQIIMVFKDVCAEDKAFIEASRTLVPEMLSALEAKDAEIEKLQAAIMQWKTADGKAVTAARAESAKLYSVLESAWWQFAYVDGNGKRWCGGLSTLEDMADALELDV